MIIYGVALLSACTVLGMLAGEYLGVFIGVEANVGGVGIAMLLLVLICDSKRFGPQFSGPTGDGLRFWSNMYIPIVVAMAASQNVRAAVDGGLLALLAGEPGRVFSRRQIMEHLWESTYVGDARAADVHVSNLRRKVERDPAHPERIVTVREVGYKLAAEAPGL